MEQIMKTNYYLLKPEGINHKKHTEILKKLYRNENINNSNKVLSKNKRGNG